MPLSVTRGYTPPRDGILLTADGHLQDLAARLWAEGDPGPAPIAIALEVFQGPPLSRDAERGLVWSLGETEFRVALPGHLDLAIHLGSARVRGSVSSTLLDDAPALAARTALEAPTAVLLGRRGWQVLHAGAVTGPRGAAVLRGGPGAGKSTLVGAAFARGLGVLADESVFVARDDPRDLSAAVRDLTFRPDSSALTGLATRTSFAFSGNEEKRRVDLFAASAPALRRATLAAPILLGDRERTPASLVRLSGEEFLAAFPEGEIPQERTAGDPDGVARAWARIGGFRLDGARDLAGALRLLESLVG